MVFVLLQATSKKDVANKPVSNPMSQFLLIFISMPSFTPLFAGRFVYITFNIAHLVYRGAIELI
jgi:hypothetical protein